MSSPDRVLAGPQCCLKTVQHVGEPVGKVIKLGDLVTYISYPAKAAEKAHKRILLFFADVAGPFFVNNQLLCDFFASHGWLVLSPDYFEGDPVTKYRKIVDGKLFVDPDFDFDAWLEKHHASSMKVTPPWLKAAEVQFGTPGAKFATVGYCFGGPFVLDLCAGDLVSAAAAAHPAYITESRLRNSKRHPPVFTTDVTNLQSEEPIFFSCAEVELPLGLVNDSRHLAEKILAENKRHYHFQLFSGVEHGFACRGDPKDENQRWAKEESANAILRWFERFCN